MGFDVYEDDDNIDTVSIKKMFSFNYERYNDHLLILILLEILFFCNFSETIKILSQQNEKSSVIIPLVFLTVESLIFKFVCFIRSENIIIDGKTFIYIIIATTISYLYLYAYLF